MRTIKTQTPGTPTPPLRCLTCKSLIVATRRVTRPDGRVYDTYYCPRCQGWDQEVDRS